MYRTSGESSIADGIYHSACRCQVEIKIRQGEAFPECPQCRHAVGWMFTRFVHVGPPPKPFDARNRPGGPAGLS